MNSANKSTQPIIKWIEEKKAKLYFKSHGLWWYAPQVIGKTNPEFKKKIKCFFFVFLNKGRNRQFKIWWRICGMVKTIKWLHICLFHSCLHWKIENKAGFVSIRQMFIFNRNAITMSIGDWWTTNKTTKFDYNECICECVLEYT